MNHNLENESGAPEYIKERNLRLKNAYVSILITIDRIQGFLDDEYLRGRIESDMTQHPEMKSTILQCTTPFCILSLGCDKMGRYNIVYSLDYRIKEMIGDDMASGLIRRIYEFTQGDMEVFVRFGSLYHDCMATYDQLIENLKTELFHELKIKEKND
jgi:hypothetical protein